VRVAPARPAPEVRLPDGGRTVPVLTRRATLRTSPRPPPSPATRTAGPRRGPGGGC